MKIASTLLLSGFLAVLPSAVSQAAENLWVLNPTGQMHISMTADSVVTTASTNVVGTVSVTQGLIELHAGPVRQDESGAKERAFVLTRLSLQFQNFGLTGRPLGDKTLPLVNVGAHLRDSVIAWVNEDGSGVYKFSMPWTHSDPPGRPALFAGANVDESYFIGPHEIDQKLFRLEGASQEFTVNLDLNTGAFQMEASFKVHQDALWNLGDVDVVVVLTLSGKIGGNGPPDLGPVAPDKNAPVGDGKKGL